MAHRFYSHQAQGFVRCATATPRVSVADPAANAQAILELARQGHDEGCDLMVFPELCVSAYAIDDLHLQAALLDDGAERGREATAESCGAFERDVVRQHAQVPVRARQRDVLREAPRLRESRLLLPFAYGGAPAVALAAAATREDEWRSYSCADFQRNASAALDDDATHLVSWRERQPVRDDVAVVALPAVPVAAADARGAHLEHYAAWRCKRSWHVLDSDGSAKFVVDAGTHGLACMPSSPRVYVRSDGSRLSVHGAWPMSILSR